MTAAKAPYHIEALARGLAVLSAFSEEEPELSLTDVAQRVGMVKSTTQRFVHTLRDLGYLQQDPVSRRYRPGARVLGLGFAALSGLELPRVAEPHLQALHQATGESASMAVLSLTLLDELPPHGPDIIYVARIKARQLLNIDLQVGSRLPAYCTGMGKVLLAYLPAETREQLLRRMTLPRRGPNTLTTLPALRAALDEIRARGIAINDEELAAGLRTVAAPVRRRDGSVVAAINVSVPASRISVDELRSRLAPLVIRAAGAISASLGAGQPADQSASAAS
jgi:IclR family pca regulon transcriptional regulator